MTDRNDETRGARRKPAPKPARADKPGGAPPARVAPAPLKPSPAPANPEARIDSAFHAALGHLSGGFSPIGLAEAWFDWAAHLATSPARAGAIARKAQEEARRLGGLALEMAVGQGQCAPCQRSLPQDRRFRHPGWQQWPFALYAESLLACERWWDEATRDVHGATKHHLDLLNFVGRQALDVVSPSNFPLTNPEVFRETLKTGGMNLVNGAALAFEDFQHMLRHQRPVGAEAYEPGETVAISPGKVVHRTELAEIIQYSPRTAKVRREPIVIVPAWIMKYYILDLRPENSLVRHLVEEGFTVFMVSWLNPRAADRGIGFDDYRRQGVMAAIAAATAITGADGVHAVGYCIGGTLLAITAAAMARDGDARLRTVTLLAAQTDFEEAGELRLFIDESQLSVLEDMMAESGVLQASRMAGTFNLLRSNDLIWSRMVARYLLGRRDPMGDVEAWSTDSTRMPARMHAEYLRRLYLDNDLAEGRFKVEGDTVALQDIRAPLFVVGTEWDHVAPWRSVYKIHQLTDTDVTFALTNGGHNQGILSQPGRSDRHYRLATHRDGSAHKDAERWLKETPEQPGSWWPAWFEWLGARSGPFVEPPPMGRAEAGFAAGTPAPGTYVRE